MRVSFKGAIGNVRNDWKIVEKIRLLSLLRKLMLLEKEEVLDTCCDLNLHEVLRIVIDNDDSHLPINR